jgi:putative tricarboxylic transport membrane protein
MALNRRHLCVAALGIPLAFAAPAAFAQDSWTPTENVEFVIPFGVGGGADLLARVIEKIIIEEKLVPVPIAMVNQPGGGGAVGLGYIAASRAGDPHTITIVNGTTQITPILNPDAKTLEYIRPVMNVMMDDFILFVKADAPWKTIQEFVEDAKSKPDKTYSFAAGGTTDVMAVTVFSKTVGKEMNVVSFNGGGEALTALLGGHVDASIANPLEFMGQFEAGAVRALGVFRDDRFPEFPDIPTMKESGVDAPNFQMWRGIAVPKDAPEEAAKYWEGVMAKVMASPTMAKYLEDNVASAKPIAGEEYEAFLANQEKLYRELLDKPAN